MPNYVRGNGPIDSKIMIVAEAPGSVENEQGIPLVGPTGKLTQEFVENSGYKWDNIYKTNVVKYQPPFNDFTKLHLIGVDLTESVKKLWSEEINVIKPNVIIALGEHALNAVTGQIGIGNWRGSITLASNGLTKVVPTIHPARLFDRPDRGGIAYVYKRIIQADFIRAIEQSFSPIYNPPIRQLDICNNSLDLFRFFREYEKIDKASVDIESINCIPVCIGFSFNKSHSITVPLLRSVGKNSLTDMSKRELIECWKLIDENLRRIKVIGQNFKYDEYKLGLIGFKNIKLYSDTLLKVHTVFPELPSKSLGMQTSLFTEEPFYKDEGKETKIGKSFNVKQFFRYCGKDCCVTLEIDSVLEDSLKELSNHFHIPLIDFYYNYVMKKHAFYLKLENNGFKVDEERKAALKEQYEEMRASVHSRLIEQVGYEINVKSEPQVFDLLYGEMNFKKFKKAPTGEDTIVALLANHCKGDKGKRNAKILEDILTERRIRDQLSRCINFIPDYDGRLKTSVRIVGTETGRRSNNILKKPIRPKKIGLAGHTIPKHGKLAKDVRSMFVPDDGKIIIQIDAGQAEARIVAVLEENYELLKAFDTVDIHRRTAGLLFGFTSSLILTPGDIGIVDHLEKDGPERFTGKTFRHAGNYDMGKGTAMITFNTNAQKYDIDMRISEWKAGHFIDLFHASDPNIRNVFHLSIKAALDSNRTLINPFGRIRQFNGRMDDSIYKEGYAQIPQSTVADLIDKAAIDIDDEFNGDTNVMFLGENHDSLVIQAPENNWEPYARVMKKYLERPIDFSTYCTLKRNFKLTIPGDIEVSFNPKTGNVTNYAELYKVKI